MMTPTPALLKLLLLNETEHALAGPFSGALDALKVGLSLGALTPGVDIVFATDITLPTYTGYAAQTCTWTAAYLADDGNYAVNGGLHNFIPTDGASPCTVLSVYLYLTGSPNTVMAVENLAVPVNMVDSFTNLAIVPEFELALAMCGAFKVVN